MFSLPRHRYSERSSILGQRQAAVSAFNLAITVWKGLSPTKQGLNLKA
jgi:hypothetical protein